MFKVFKKEMEWGGRPLTIETGKLARQADGAVMVTYGGTQVLATACFSTKEKPGQSFFPLTVNYQEKFYAGGKIPGGFFRREGRPTEKETLTSRLIDRPLRPLFPAGFKNETQIVLTVMSSDGENDSIIPSLIGASAALTLSGAPFMGPIAAAAVGYKNGEYILNPTYEQEADTELKLTVAGTSEGVTMVESEASELSEEVMLGAVMFAKDAFQPVIEAIIELAEACAKPGFEFVVPDNSELLAKLSEAYAADVKAAYAHDDKWDRKNAMSEVKAKAVEEFAGEESEYSVDLVKGMMKTMEGETLRSNILKDKVRIGGRTSTEIRPIICETDILNRAHGSALFTRGETQAIAITTLGTGRDEQMIDAIEGEYKDNFMLHYNFPPYSVGEAGRMGGTSRREYGHGMLARRALTAMLPTREEWPYTTRVVAEILSCNGSSSMATVCSSSMSLMAAGVPMKRPVAGIAMGLIKEGDDYAILSDILGDEDALGDMDFKVCGTENGITALQMDIKITSINKEIMEQALAQAKDGRIHILGKMAEAIDTSRDGVSDTAPQMHTIMIPTDKIREVIGTGGKVIRNIIEVTGAGVDIEDDGTCRVSSADKDGLKAAIDMIEGILAVAEVGKNYTSKIVRITDFGAFVAILPNQDGLVHISEICSIRLGAVDTVLAEGDEVTVNCLEVDERGKVRLTMKGIDQNEAVAAKITAAEEGGDQPRQERKDADNKGRRPRRSA
ncbi:MAG: polyribonucleotide nucleotidyltransferase [Alphaproteobacteria bacterium]|jgi:polyribonucleotide nucleotidyltransferase